MIRAIVDDNKPLSEQLICEMHQVLVTGLDIEHRCGPAIPWRSSAGRYRTIPVAAGNMFRRPTTHTTENGRNDLTLQQRRRRHRREAGDRPFYIAAKYLNMFVLIHPFVDGNGRMCRIILNALLLRYAGTAVAFWGDKVESRKYIAIVQRAGEEVADCQLEFAAFVLEKGEVEGVEGEVGFRGGKCVDLPESR